MGSSESLKTPGESSQRRGLHTFKNLGNFTSRILVLTMDWISEKKPLVLLAKGGAGEPFLKNARTFYSSHLALGRNCISRA